MKQLLGRIDRARLVGMEIKCLDGWKKIVDIKDFGRYLDLVLADESTWTIGLWQEVEVRDAER